MVKKCHNKKVKESFIINNLNFRKVQEKITCNIQMINLCWIRKPRMPPAQI